jgi:peptidyl-dipeptidase Dcp
MFYSFNRRNNTVMISYEDVYGALLFDRITPDDFLPALKEEMIKVRDVIGKIISAREDAVFNNTILPLEQSAYELKRIQNTLFNLNSAETSEGIQQAAREVSPVLTDFFSDITLNRDIYRKVKQASAGNESPDKEQLRLTDHYMKDFVRNGAELDEASREEFREILRELSVLTLRFGENLLRATNAYTLNITDEKDISGLPSFIADTAAAEASSREQKGWTFTLKAPSYVPFMKYADNRELRKEMYLAYNSRCFKGDENDNRQIIKRIASLRRRKAVMLGYRNYAGYVLEERMAGTPESVAGFIRNLISAAKPHAEKEFRELQEYAKNRDQSVVLMPWDWMYYSEKLKEERFSVTDEMIKPYLELENVIKGIFTLANRLYGITFTAENALHGYHKDVRIFRISDVHGAYLGILYLDFFPRAGKQGGAWMTNYLEQYRKDGANTRPHVSLVFNFTAPSSENEPVLLTYEELRTFLHEFGHSLHSILSDVSFMSLSGTNVYLDFVELPSQIMENWAEQKEWLGDTAIHYKTKEKIPGDLIEKILELRNFQGGYAFMRQLNFSVLDMAWHTLENEPDLPVDAFEEEATAQTSLFPPVEGCNFSTIFSHIFGGGYAAGYYGYKWAEVLDADAFSLFREKGIYSREVADSFRRNILSKGDTENPMELFRHFRGREPSQEPLLVRSGLK